MFCQASSPLRGSRSTLSRTELISPIGARTSRSGSFSWYQASWASSRSRKNPAASRSASEVELIGPSAASVAVMRSARAAKPSGL